MLIRIMLMLILATPAFGQVLPTGIARIHVKQLDIWDTGGYGLTFGPYDSGMADCDWTDGYPPKCEHNGYIHIDWSGNIPPDEFYDDPSEYGITAVYWFHDPSDGTNVIVTDNLGPQSRAGEWDYVVLRRSITGDRNGEPLKFDNGATFPDGGTFIVNYVYDDQNMLGHGPLFFELDNVGTFTGSGSAQNLLFDTFIGWNMQFQVENNFANEMVAVPVPEPTLVAGLMFGTIGLCLIGHNRGSRN